MTKINSRMILIPLIWVLATCGLLYAGDQETVFQDDCKDMIIQQRPIGEASPVSDIEIISDEFGGYLYFYNDGLGNKCVTNQIDNMIGTIPAAGTGEEFLPTSLSGEDDMEKTLLIAEVKDGSDDMWDDSEEDEAYKTISDPLEPINRIFFQFNDKLYFWFLKPVASGYRAVVPQILRMNAKNFFENLAFPIRFVNCILQGKIGKAGNELNRFMMNSTAGFGGLFDIAATHSNLKEQDEDLGQTLGSYGLGPIFFINWPFLGPSSVRDTFGDVGDSFLDPLSYMAPRTKYNLSIKGYKTVNNTSLVIGDYEDLKKSALDPYIAFRDAYFQYRMNKVKE